MLFFLGSVLFLVIGLPLLFFVLGHGEAYVTWGPWISAIALMLWLLMDVDKIRRGKGCPASHTPTIPQTSFIRFFPRKRIATLIFCDVFPHPTLQ